MHIIKLALLGFALACGNIHANELSNSVLLFEDDFERNESQEVTDELGQGWSTNSAKRAGGNKQVDLGDGTLHVCRHATADHAVSVVHPAKYKDCRVEVKFRLDSKDDDLGIDFADMQCNEVHAGHICKVFFRADGVEIQDLKSGRMNKAYHDAVKANAATDAQKSAAKRFQRKLDHPLALEKWHSAVVVITGNAISVEIDEKKIGSFASAGMDHPTKDTIRFSARREVWMGDVRVFAVDSDAIASDAKEKPVKHLFVATLLLRRMKSVGITPEQLTAFNNLSGDLRSQIDDLRAEVGITAETIKRRDEVYSQLKSGPLQGDELYRELQKRGGFTDAQRDGFQETQKQYKAFKSAALELLTKKQRIDLPKPRKRK